jgi:hypothetical protein
MHPVPIRLLQGSSPMYRPLRFTLGALAFAYLAGSAHAQYYPYNPYPVYPATAAYPVACTPYPVYPQAPAYAAPVYPQAPVYATPAYPPATNYPAPYGLKVIGPVGSEPTMMPLPPMPMAATPPAVVAPPVQAKPVQAVVKPVTPAASPVRQVQAEMSVGPALTSQPAQPAKAPVPEARPTVVTPKAATPETTVTVTEEAPPAPSRWKRLFHIGSSPAPQETKMIATEAPASAPVPQPGSSKTAVAIKPVVSVPDSLGTCKSAPDASSMATAVDLPAPAAMAASPAALAPASASAPARATRKVVPLSEQ